MENKIQHIVILLKQLNDIIEKYKDGTALSLDGMQFILDMTKDCSDTNSLIDYAECAAHENVEQLKLDCQTLQHETNRFFSLYDEQKDFVQFIRFDTKALCEEHLKKYKDEWDAQRAITLTLWREYCNMSNRLDMMDMADPEFAELGNLCDQKKAEHDKSKEKCDTLYNIYKEKERAEIATNFVEMSYVCMIVSRVSQIAQCVITDINNLRKEGVV